MQSWTILLLVLHLHFILGDWIDPHSMDSNSKKKLSDLPQPTKDTNTEHCFHVETSAMSDVYFKRIVRVILNYASEGDEVGFREGYIHVKLSPKEHNVLLSFSQNKKVDERMFIEVSGILERALKKPNEDGTSEMILSAQEKLFSLFFNPTSTSLFCACLALFILYKLIRAKFTWKSIIKYFVSLLYIVDFVYTYTIIRRDEEIESMVNIKKYGAAPPECDPQKMSWWTYMKTQFETTTTEHPCKTYYQAMYPNFIYVVAPSKILTLQFRTIILQPIGDCGEAFGKFGRGLFTNLPWGLNIVLFPLMLVAACAFLFILFVFITKTQFKLSLFHLFTIELGQPHMPSVQSQSGVNQIEYKPGRSRNRNKRNKNNQVGLEFNPRVLMEEVSPDKCSSENGENNSRPKEQTSEKQTQKRGDNSTVSASNSETFTSV